MDNKNLTRKPNISITGKVVELFIREDAPDEPEALPVGPLAGGNPRTAPVDGTTELGFVVGIPPDSDGDGAGENNESGTTVGGALSVGNCCDPASSRATNRTLKCPQKLMSR